MLSAHHRRRRRYRFRRRPFTAAFRCLSRGWTSDNQLTTRSGPGGCRRSTQQRLQPGQSPLDLPQVPSLFLPQGPAICLDELADSMHLLLHRRHALSECNPGRSGPCLRRLILFLASLCRADAFERTRLDSVPRFRAATTVRGSRSNASAAPARPRSRTSSAGSAISRRSCWSGAPPLPVTSGLPTVAGLPPAGPTGSRGTPSTPCPALFPGIQNAPFVHLATGTSPTVKIPGTGRLCSPETPGFAGSGPASAICRHTLNPCTRLRLANGPTDVQVRLSGHHMGVGGGRSCKGVRVRTSIWRDTARAGALR